MPTQKKLNIIEENSIEPHKDITQPLGRGNYQRNE